MSNKQVPLSKICQTSSGSLTELFQQHRCSWLCLSCHYLRQWPFGNLCVPGGLGSRGDQCIVTRLHVVFSFPSVTWSWGSSMSSLFIACICTYMYMHMEACGRFFRPCLSTWLIRTYIHWSRRTWNQRTAMHYAARNGRQEDWPCRAKGKSFPR